MSQNTFQQRQQQQQQQQQLQQQQPQQQKQQQQQQQQQPQKQQQHQQQQQQNFGQQQPGQPQINNMNQGQQFFRRQPQQQQQQQFNQNQMNNIPNGHQPFGNPQNNKFNQFGNQPSGNGVSVLSQSRNANGPPYQGMQAMPQNQNGFQNNQPQGHMTQYNPQQQPGNTMFNQMPTHGQMTGPQHGQMPMQNMGQGMQMPGPQVSGPMVNVMPGQTGPSASTAMGQQPNVQGQKPYIGPGQPFQSNPNLAVIDHPVKPTTTPKPPSSTVDGEGLVCMTTADCEVGCCFNTTGQLLDTTTYGAGGPQEGRGMLC